MLVLTRKLNEKIIIKDPVGVKIVITVTQIKNSEVRLGIEAPPDMIISREELTKDKK